MRPSSGPVVIETAGDRDGTVMAIVRMGDVTDDVLRRAIEEASIRSGALVVLQVVDEPSAIRRAVAKARLNLDVSWWSRDLDGITTSVDVIERRSLHQAATWRQRPACVVIDAHALASDPGLATDGCGEVAATEHPWPPVRVVPTDHSR